MTQVEAFCARQYPVLQMELFCVLDNIYVCIFMYIIWAMGMAPITLFCKSNGLFKNMFNILHFFETNSILVLPLFQREMQAKQKQELFPIVSGSHSFAISVPQSFTVKEFKELLMLFTS